MWRTTKRRKQTCVGVLRSKWGSCSLGGVWRTTKQDSTGYYLSPLSTSSSLHLRLFTHGLLFIQPPPLLHRLLFNQPSSWGPIQQPLHGLLFIQPSTGYRTTSPPPATVQPAIHGVLFIQPSTGSCSSTGSIDRGTVHPAATASTTTGSCSSNPHRELFIQTPQQRSLFIQRQHRLASVSSSSKGITRSGSVNS